jgi:DNA-binding LacI/PurR family transcriptional regulator
MQDIADHLGLSVSTVSLALRSAPQIAEDTRQRVRETADRLGYTHRPRHIVPATLKHIVFMTYTAPDNEFYGAVLTGAERECRRYNMALHYQQIETSISSFTARQNQIEGVLIVGNVDERTIEQLCTSGRVHVLVDNNPSSLEIDRIVIKNRKSVHAAITYLHQLGHQRIAYLSGPLTHSSFRERRQGYYAAINELGLEPFEIPCSTLDAHDITRAVSRHLVPGAAVPFTAIMACNDLAALSIQYSLQEQGIRVPDQVAIIGFDDIDVASVVRPSLTTCHVDRELLGMLAVRRLIERVSEPEKPMVTVAIATTLIQRGSTNAPRSGAIS